MNYTLQQLKYLIAVADHGSVSAAARALFVSQPAVSAAILHLEQIFGIQCFVRHRARGVTLTAAGRAFIAEARQVMEKAESLQGHAGRLNENLPPRLSIGCLSSIGPCFLPRILERFEQAHPETVPTIFDGNTECLVQRLRSGDTDVALMHDLQPEPSIQTIPLVTLKPYVLLSRSHPLARKSFASLNQLLEQPLILLNRPEYEQHLSSIFDGYTDKPRIGHRVTTLDLLRGLVAAGAGYAILNTKPLQDHGYESNKLVCLPILEDVPSSRIILAISQRAGLRRNARAFAEIAVECIKSFDPVSCHWNEPPAPLPFGHPLQPHAATEFPKIAESA